jgi:ferrochelatase
MPDPGAREPAVGVLLVNLGTPAAPTPAAVRRYLAEFLWDPRVIEVPRVLWWSILHGVILRLRPRRSAATYAEIWQPEGSPLLLYSQALADRLQEALDARYAGRVRVRLAMRYGNPSMAEAMNALREEGIGRLLLLPLYPQYSATTTASVIDRAGEILKLWRVIPAFRTIDDYHDEPAYVAAIASSIRHHWDAAGRGERLLFSFHGIPRQYCAAGDPYPERCKETARLVAAQLELSETDHAVAFQSRFGLREWVRPYTDETLREWARGGCRRVDIVCPGFAVDCLETLEEIAIRNRDDFIAAGGAELRYVPALNASQDHAAALAGLVGRHLCGWLDPR